MNMRLRALLIAFILVILFWLPFVFAIKKTFTHESTLFLENIKSEYKDYKRAWKNSFKVLKTNKKLKSY